jgi:hypothetical protein
MNAHEITAEVRKTMTQEMQAVKVKKEENELLPLLLIGMLGAMALLVLMLIL